MVAEVEIPTSKSEEGTILGADGTGFKRQPGKKGEVRFVLEIKGNGTLHPIGVWAGTSWQQISKEVKERQAGQASLFFSDGERALEKWMGKLAQEQSRCHWHFSRELSYSLWRDGVSKEERDDEKENARRLLAIELSAADMEDLPPKKRRELAGRIESAEAELADLEGIFLEKGYHRAATYVGNAKDRLSGYLRTWMATGKGVERTPPCLAILAELKAIELLAVDGTPPLAILTRRHSHQLFERAIESTQ